MFRFSVALLAAIAAVSASSHITKSEITQIPSGWSKYDTPSPDHRLNLRIALNSPRFDELERELLEISDPGSSRWTNHLSKEQVEELVAPHPETLDLLDEFFSTHGLDLSSAKFSPAKDWVHITVSVAQAESLFDTTYYVYKHSSGATAVRTPSYKLPEHLHAHIDDIQPTNYFGRPSALTAGAHIEDEIISAKKLADGVAAAAAAAAPFNLSLAQFKELYNIDNFKPSGKHGNNIGITGYLEQYANLADLKQFYAAYVPAAVNTTLKVVNLNGAINSQNASDAGVEAALDVQWAGGITWPIPNIFYSTYGRGQNTQPNISYEDNGNEPYDLFINTLLKYKDSDLPKVLTTSYGEGETSVPYAYAKKVCQLYGQLGSRGVSVLHSSGDGGVGNGDPDKACTTPNRFGPIFPASCPYVTAVGATYLIPETTVDFSGGGFSDYFPRPVYQSAVIPKYIKSLGNTYEGLYNKSGRAFPDVSAQGYRFEVIYQGRLVHVSGTSASCPAFAGVVALLNDLLLSKGRRQLGFLNPFIYTLGQFGLNDITTGSNPGCGTTGFNATKGWDAATGFGTPDFAKLRKILLV